MSLSLEDDLSVNGRLVWPSDFEDLSVTSDLMKLRVGEGIVVFAKGAVEMDVFEPDPERGKDVRTEADPGLDTTRTEAVDAAGGEDVGLKVDP